MITIAILKWIKKQMQAEEVGLFAPVIAIIVYIIAVLQYYTWIILACDFVLLGIWTLIKASKKQKIRTQEATARSLHLEANRRRAEARSQCELLYTVHECEIRERFSREALEAYMTKFMGDSESPQVVERRGTELKAVIQKHRASVGTAEKKPASISELAKWFIEEKARIEALPLDETMRATHVAHLNMRYAELSQEILESIRP